MVFAQRKAGWRADARPEPVTWRSWVMPGCSAMQRNHWPPSLTMVVPASTRAHSRLVSPVWKPRTTCRRACSGRPAAEVSIAMIKGVWPRRPRPEPSPVRSPPIYASSISNPRAGGAQLVTAITFEHRLHQLVLKPPGGVCRNAEPPSQLDIGEVFLALGEKMHGAKPHPHWQLGTLEDGSGDQRCLVSAAPALKQLTVPDL